MYIFTRPAVFFMMYKKSHSLVLSFTLAFCLVLSLNSKAQDSITYKRFIEVGLSGNAYRGDLQAGYEKFTSGFHLGIQWMKKKRLNGAISMQIGSVSGQNPDYKYTGDTAATNPNKYFKTSIFTLHYELQLNIIKKPRYRIYISQGIGILRYKPKDANGDDLASQLPSRADGETYGTTALILPTQAGFQYFLANGIGTGFKIGWYNPQTDYIDNISKWGNRDGKDKIFIFKFSILVPIRGKNEKAKPTLQ